MREVTIEPAYPIGSYSVEMNQMDRVPTEFVSGVIVAIWQDTYRIEDDFCFPKRFCRGLKFEVGDKIRCRKSQVYQLKTKC